MTAPALARAQTRIVGRQKALWFTVVPLTLFSALLPPRLPGTGGVEDLATTGQMLAIFTGIAYAAAFTDFFIAPAHLGMQELEAASPVSPVVLRGARLLGAFAVATTPSLVVLLGAGAVQAVRGDPWSVAAGIAVAATTVTPAALLAMSLSGLAGALLPRALGRVAAVLVWFALVFSTPLIPLPSLNGTVLNVVGDTVAEGYFGAQPLYESRGALSVEATPLTATVSLLWQFALVAGVLLAGSRLAEGRKS